MPDWATDSSVNAWWHSFDFPTGERISGVRSKEDLQSHLARFPIGDDLHGKRVLDIGTWDGWFSFECERRGAEVVAIDRWDNPRFRYAHAQFDSHVDYLVKDVYDLTPRELGHFDIVLFFGVLYHLKHPLLALEKVCALSRDSVYLESHVLDRDRRDASKSKRPIIEIYETDELAGQTDNWTGPNSDGLLALCRIAGFARVSLLDVTAHRAYVACYRSWASGEGDRPEDAPVLVKAVNNFNGGINFSSNRDEYVSCWFRSTGQRLTRDDVQPAVGAWGSIPLSVEQASGDVWQANFKLPPGLDQGFHDVTLRTRHGRRSAPARIAVDVPPQCDALVITGVCDGRTWKPGQVLLTDTGLVSIWVEGLPENADVTNTQVLLGSRALRVDCIVREIHSSSVQINAILPSDVAFGPASILVTFANAVSQTVPVTINTSGSPGGSATIDG